MTVAPADLVMRAAVSRARDAQPAWAARGVDGRCRLIERARQLLYRDRAAVAACISAETHKPMAEAIVAEVAVTLDIARFTARMAPAVLAPSHQRSATLALWRKRITVHHAPWGVVGVIAPWNYPLMLPASHILANLAAGSTVVCKPSELTPRTAEMFANLLHEAGIPPDVLQVVPGDGALGAALVHAGVDRICFTGSVATGRRVAAACGEALIPCSMELGGSDPALVLADADIDIAARGITWGRFTNAGQTCVAPKRVFVVDAAWDRFVRALESEVGRLRTRTPGTAEWDMGPLISDSAARTLRGMRDAAVTGGARVLAGGTDHEGVMRPCVLVDVPADAAILHEETFGPVLPVVRVRDTEAAIEAANAGTWGLSASVWTRDRRRGTAVASRLRAGTVVINDVVLVAGVAEAPHGGVGASGFGRLHGIAGLQEATRTHTVVDDIAPWRSQPWWFPYGSAFASQVDAYTRLAHGRSWWERLGGLRGTLALLRRR